jgi:cell division protein FtsB
MNIPGIQAALSKLISSNASTILTAGGVVGTALTATLAAKASFKAAELIREEQAIRDAAAHEQSTDEERVFSPDLTKWEKFKIVGPLYIPTVIIGGLTITSIVASNQVSAKRAAALAAAYGVSQDRVQELKDKMAEKLSGPKNQQALDEIAQERVDKNPPREVIIMGNGDVLCFDEYTGRYFRSTHSAIMLAQNKVNDDLFQVQYASLSSFYDQLGLNPTSMSNELGWNLATTGALEVRITAVQSPQTQEPCLSVDFVVPPRAEYRQNY